MKRATAAGGAAPMEVDSTVKSGKMLPWVEKYRPSTVDEVSHQEEVVRTLKKSMETGNMPHLMFYGPPGTGKTSCILAIAKQLYGPVVYKQRVLELNASDERGIQVVREKVKKFAQVLVKGKPPGAEGYPCPPYKIIILDEADSMTPDAQAALRRIMENYTKVTRFCIICNYISKIIEPLASRCAKFRFQPVSDEAHLARLQLIASQEGVGVEPEAYTTLLQLAEGDLRRSITLMQTASNLIGTGHVKNAVTKRSVVEVAGHVPEEIISRIMHACRGNFEQVQACVKDVCAEGYSCSQMLHQILSWVLNAPLDVLSNTAKARLLGQTFPTCDQALTEGADELLQLLSVCAQLQSAFKMPK